MNADHNSQTAILIEEVHYYDIELAEISTTVWRKAEGSIQVRVPYDGAIFKEDASSQETFHIGNLLVTRPNGTEPESETLSVDIEAGENWWEYIKSGKRAVCHTDYAVSPPKETLISVQGDVLDFMSSADIIFSNVAAFQNPLHLQLDLWMPDMADYGPEEGVTKLEKMMLKREHAQQIFMEYTGNFGQQLAQNLVALSNSYGGTLFVGVDKKGKITGLSGSEIDKIPGLLLEAALKATPPIRLRRAELYQMTSGRWVYVITVPLKSPGIMHSLDGQVYQRQKKETVSVLSRTTTSEVEAATLAGKSLDDLVESDNEGRLQPRNNVDVGVLDGSTGLKSLPIGRYICAMINSGISEADIVICELPQVSQKDVESHLKNELKRIVPYVPPGVVELTKRDDQVVALIMVPIEHIPVALYQEEGYVLEKGQPQSFSRKRLLERYIAKYSDGLEQPGSGDIWLKSALIKWPIRPPEKMVLLNDTKRPSFDNPVYDVQHHALTWKPSSFDKDDAFGYKATLNLPLTSVSLITNEKGEIINQPPIVTGQIEVTLDGIVASGLSIVTESEMVEDTETEKESFLHTLPIIKRTHLKLNFTARLGEIFRHRRPQQSLLHFFLSDTVLDVGRARDVVLACADAGFRLYITDPYTDSDIPEVSLRDSEPLENGRILIKEALIKGIRNSRFHDIHLLLGLWCLPSPLTRELHYEDVHDTARVKSFTLEVGVVLEGKGEDVGQEISRLQMWLFELLRQRLQQVGAEDRRWK